MSRWCKVIGEHFDFPVSPTKMVSAIKDDIVYLPEYIIEVGVSAGLLKRIPRPQGWTVDKSGRIQRVH